MAWGLQDSNKISNSAMCESNPSNRGIPDPYKNSIIVSSIENPEICSTTSSYRWENARDKFLFYHKQIFSISQKKKKSEKVKQLLKQVT